MKGKRELLRVGLPIDVEKLLVMLSASDADTTDGASVRHYNGALIVEVDKEVVADVPTLEEVGPLQ